MTRRRWKIQNMKENMPCKDRQGLVDDQLAPASVEAAETVKHSLIEPPGRRAAAVFCGVADYDWVQEVQPKLVGDLLLECLPQFIHQAGGQVAYAVRLSGPPCDEVLTPIQQSVVVDGQTRRILDTGYLFIRFPDRRVVVSAEDFDTLRGLRKLIGVRSNRDAAAFFR